MEKLNKIQTLQKQVKENSKRFLRDLRSISLQNLEHQKSLKSLLWPRIHLKNQSEAPYLSPTTNIKVELMLAISKVSRLQAR